MCLRGGYGFVWKCWVYSQWNSHLIGIMISKTIGFRGTLFSDTPIWFFSTKVRQNDRKWQAYWKYWKYKIQWLGRSDSEHQQIPRWSYDNWGSQRCIKNLTPDSVGSESIGDYCPNHIDWFTIMSIPTSTWAFSTFLQSWKRWSLGKSQQFVVLVTSKVLSAVFQHMCMWRMSGIRYSIGPIIPMDSRC